MKKKKKKGSEVTHARENAIKMVFFRPQRLLKKKSFSHARMDQLLEDKLFKLVESLVDRFKLS